LFVATADLDGDAVLDLVVTNRSLLPGSVSVLTGNGDGSFKDPVPFMTGGLTRSVVVADFDGDGNPDLATANIDNYFGSSGVSVLLGNGDGTFHAATTFAIGRDPRSIAAADIDGDTVVDLVTANAFTLDVSLLLGNGDGSFRDAVHLLMGGGPTSVALADLDGDAAPDFVTANQTNYLSILRNQCQPGARPKIVIKPGSDPNSINPSLEGVLPVAILGSEIFDVADVDVTTLAFGHGGAALAHLRGPHFHDVNHDGIEDLLAHFWVKDTGIAFGDRMACLAGKTLDGKRFEGCDSVRTVPDMDGDSLLDADETAIGTHALRFDSDGDGYGDGEEVHVLGTDPLDALDPKPVVVREPRRKGRRHR